MNIELNKYTNREFSRGRSRFIEILWIILQSIFVSSWIPGTFHRCFLLRLFGARIGKGVAIKPGIRVKFPWRLEIGDHSWIGEDVWIDNLANVQIGTHCCLSQGVYLCTGSHNWKSTTFNLIVKPIKINHGAWIAAQAILGPGITIGEGAILLLGGCAVKDMGAWGIYQGNPAKLIRKRKLTDSPHIKQ